MANWCYNTIPFDRIYENNGINQIKLKRCQQKNQL